MYQINFQQNKSQTVVPNIPELYECTVHKIKQTLNNDFHKDVTKAINQKIYRYGFSKHRFILQKVNLPKNKYNKNEQKVYLTEKEDNRCISRAKKKLDQALGKFRGRTNSIKDIISKQRKFIRNRANSRAGQYQ